MILMTATRRPNWGPAVGPHWYLLAAVLWLQATRPVIAAPGDISFRAENLTVSSGFDTVLATVDVYLDVESATAIAANGWSLAAKLKAQSGAEGDVRFVVPTTGSHLPNLPPAKSNTFTQFDVAQEGKSYGSIGETVYEILAFAPLILPDSDPPVIDAFGNLSLPAGAGLVSLPIAIESGTKGDFLLSFVSTPQWTGVSYATSSETTESSQHPLGNLISGMIRVQNYSTVSCDFNSDLDCDSLDIDLLNQKIRTHQMDVAFDLNGDLAIDENDRLMWVETLKRTYFGDSNFDLQFNTTDLLVVFQAGEYEDDLPGNSGWATGDWDGDAEFDTGDLVLAFQRNGFEQGPRSTVASVPEPNASFISLLMAMGMTRARRRPSVECLDEVANS